MLDELHYALGLLAKRSFDVPEEGFCLVFSHVIDPAVAEVGEEKVRSD